MNVAADSTKCNLEEVKHSFCVAVVAGNQYVVGERFDKLKLISILLKDKAKHWKPDLQCLLVLGNSPYCHFGTFVFRQLYIIEVRNC